MERARPRPVHCAIYAALAGAALVASFAQASEQRIEVQVKNLRNAKGSVRCGLFASEETWLDPQPMKGVRVTLEGRSAICAFSGIQPGTYAVSVLHDEDDDGEMDKSALGLPEEGYGASRDAARKGVGAPDWDDARFDHRQHTELKIHLVYR